MTTLHDIANRLNVSPGLVSGVLNGKSGVRTREETRQRILETAREMDYQPSAAARALRTGKTRQFAAVLVGNTGGQFLDIEGLVAGAREENYRVVILPLQSGPHGEQEFGEFLANRACDGVCLFAPQVTEAHLHLISRYNIPCVIIGALDNQALAESALKHAAVVEHDNYRAAFDSVCWLHAQGKQRIAWAKSPGEAEQPHTRALRNGYSDAMQRCRLEPLVLEHFTNGDETHSFISARRVDAVIVRYMHGALGWMMAARSAGLQLPRDLTIMCHLEAHDVANLVLCKAAQLLALHLYDVREIGYRAAQILLRWAEGESPTEHTILVAPHSPTWGENQ